MHSDFARGTATILSPVGGKEKLNFPYNDVSLSADLTIDPEAGLRLKRRKTVSSAFTRALGKKGLTLIYLGGEEWMQKGR